MNYVERQQELDVARAEALLELGRARGALERYSRLFVNELGNLWPEADRALTRLQEARSWVDTSWGNAQRELIQQAREDDKA